MSNRLIQITGITWTILYAACVVWLYGVAPRSLAEVKTGASVAVGVYTVDSAHYDAALALFRRGEYRAARDEWGRADPAQRDARTQFYIAYAFYREGWGRLYNDDALFRSGLEAVNRAINLSPQGALTIDDADLGLKSAAELKAELERGTETSLSDFNPLKLVRERK